MRSGNAIAEEERADERDCYTKNVREAGGRTQLLYFSFEGSVFLYEAGRVDWRRDVRRLLMI
jgi:hypothetical protein